MGRRGPFRPSSPTCAGKPRNVASSMQSGRRFGTLSSRSTSFGAHAVDVGCHRRAGTSTTRTRSPTMTDRISMASVSQREPTNVFLNRRAAVSLRDWLFMQLHRNLTLARVWPSGLLPSQYVRGSSTDHGKDTRSCRPLTRARHAAESIVGHGDLNSSGRNPADRLRSDARSILDRPDSPTAACAPG